MASRSTGAFALAGPDKASPFSLFKLALFRAMKFAWLKPHGRSAAHLTLAYEAVHILPEMPLTRPIQWQMQRFVLAHSVRGEQDYEVLDEWGLDGR